MLPYTSQIAEKPFFFFQLPHLEYEFTIANIILLNLSVLKISETFQEHTSGGELYY